MSLTDQLIEEMVRHPDAKQVVLSQKTFHRLRSEIGPGYLYVGTSDRMTFLGFDLVKYRPTGWCRNCGAPSEPEQCSYCKSPSEFFEFK